MKPLALALAAAFLGTGCFVGDDDDVGTVNLYWDFVRSAPAQTGAGGIIVYDDDDGEVEETDGPCSESGVDFVTVQSPRGDVEVDCVYGGVEGVAIDGIVEGVRPFRFIGWRGAVAVYDRTVSLEVRGNVATDHFVDVNGVSRPLDMFAYLATGTPPNETDYLTCGAAGSPNIDFEIREVVFDEVVERGFVGCSDPLPATVFVGDLDLDNYNVRMRGLRTSDDAVVLDSCDVPLDHFDAQTGVEGFAPTLLTNPVPTCT
jgi:hypothetical protein